jgi:hypothetical protein
MKPFNATLRPGQTDFFFIGAELPGVGYSLNFFRWEGDQSICACRKSRAGKSAFVRAKMNATLCSQRKDAGI